MSRPNRHKRQRSLAQNVTFNTPNPALHENQGVRQYEPRHYENLETDVKLEHDNMNFDPLVLPRELPVWDVQLQEPLSMGYQSSEMLQNRGMYTANTEIFPKAPDPVPFPYARHTKNISISSHLDMFSLSDGYGKFKKDFSKDDFQDLGGFRGQENFQEKEMPEHELSEKVLHDLLPQLLQVGAANYLRFLHTILTERRLFFLIDDLFNLLYKPQAFDAYFQSTPAHFKIDSSPPTGSVGAGIEVNRRVLDIFDKPALYEAPGSKKLSSVKNPELLRSYLALKIVCTFVVYEPRRKRAADCSGSESEYPEVEEENSLRRISIYRMYYLVCKQLVQKYHERLSAEQKAKMILGNAKIGKLIKLAYPDMKLKRLGRRGDSKYSYLGLRWNKNVVTKEMVRICDEELEHVDGINEPSALKNMPGPFFPLSYCGPDFWAQKSTKSRWFRSVETKCMKKVALAGLETLFLLRENFERGIADRQWVRTNLVQPLCVMSRRNGGVSSSLLFLCCARTFQLLWSGLIGQEQLLGMLDHVQAETGVEDDARFARFLKRLASLGEVMQGSQPIRSLLLFHPDMQDAVLSCIVRTLRAFDVENLCELATRICASISSLPRLLSEELDDSPDLAETVRVFCDLFHGKMLSFSWLEEVPISVAVEVFVAVTSTCLKHVRGMTKKDFETLSSMAFAFQEYMIVVSEIISHGQRVESQK